MALDDGSRQRLAFIGLTGNDDDEELLDHNRGERVTPKMIKNATSTAVVMTKGVVAPNHLVIRWLLR